MVQISCEYRDYSELCFALIVGQCHSTVAEVRRGVALALGKIGFLSQTYLMSLI